MSTIRIDSKHDFKSKLLQPAILPRVKDYIKWQQQTRRARSENKIPPKAPNLYPLSINLDITNACNFRCDYCIDKSILNNGNRFFYGDLISSLDQMIERGLLSVILIGGGEPTLYPRFRELVRFLKERGVQVAIVSNGSRNQTIYDIVDCLDKNDWVRLSLDSGSNDTFTRIHKPKSNITLEEICSWVPRIRRRNPRLPVGFSFLINNINNADEVVMATKLAREYNFGYISFKPLLTRGPKNAEVIDAVAMVNFNRTIASIKKAVSEAKKFETDNFKIVESTNLRVLMNGTWRNFTCQPKICHIQSLRQVLSPIGLFNCPAHRGSKKAQLEDKDAFSPQKADATQKSIATAIGQFDASRECDEVVCLYNPVNWWIEGIIRREDGLSCLEPAEERYDYFL